VFFDRDRVSLPQSAAPAIDRQAAFLRDNPTINVTIKTYCSPGEGKREGTETLAALRVNQIRDALKARGIAADRIAAEPGCQVAGADRQPGRLARAEDPRAELLRN
jgi:outer membrane protein OmpA-like peptidoglycan-associated protein